MKGTLLNTATVAMGASVGLLAGRGLPTSYQEVALHGLGLVTAVVGIGMGLKARNPLITAAAVAGGGVLGMALGIENGIEAVGEWAKAQMGGEGGFVNAFVSSFVLFCVGPMTVLGCIEDGLEGRSDLLRLKSTMDGIAAIFLAAGAGAGVLAVAPAILLFQGGLTLAAKKLAPLARHESAMAALSGAGGCILLGTALGLMGVANLHTAHYLPAIAIAPLLAMLEEKFSRPSV